MCIQKFIILEATYIIENCRTSLHLLTLKTYKPNIETLAIVDWTRIGELSLAIDISLSKNYTTNYTKNSVHKNYHNTNKAPSNRKKKKSGEKKLRGENSENLHPPRSPSPIPRSFFLMAQLELGYWSTVIVRKGKTDESTKVRPKYQLT